MRISMKADYACIAALELALRYDDPRPLPLSKIVDRRGIPEGFLAQILADLQKAGLVESTRGSSGGYRLARPPSRVSVGDVLRAVEGPMAILKCFDRAVHEGCDLQPLCSFRTIWGRIQKAFADQIDRLTFDELAAEAGGCGVQGPRSKVLSHPV